ncbi:MAG: diguanylate cyclase [Alphaproteobacteria bacterium]
MLEEMTSIIVQGFNQYGLESIGYLIMGLCFGMFFIRSTQKRRFHLISTGCYVLAFGMLLLVLLPALVVLNPNFLISPKGYNIIRGVTVSLGCSFFWGSLLVSALGISQLLFCTFLFFVFQVIFIHVFQMYFPDFNLSYLMLSLCWIVVGFSFHLLHNVGKTSLFDRVGDAFFILAFYYIAREFNFISGTGWLPVLVFVGVSVAVLMAQIKFMESTCLALEGDLLKEKQRQTLFWDIAPFPILVSKLLDDSVLYINPVAREVLKVSPEEISQFHLTDYFMDATKRDELIAQTRQNKIVDHFSVQMKSPKTGDTIWLNISSRVVEWGGELALYMNLQDITKEKKTEEKLFKEASTDTLTGLFNRRQFEAMTNVALANCVRQKIPYSMMMLDIDHFKHVNDTFGHDMGDVVLKRVADILNQAHRDSDIIARYGGEEFIVFLSNTDVEGAKIAAERIRSSVEQAVIMAGDTQVPVTISLGITNSQNGDIAAMTKEADIALYHSKENGRNQATVYTSEMQGETGANV